MTTPRVANSSVLSIPSNADAESAAKPSGPVTCTVRSGAAATSLICSARPGAFSQPFGPRSNVTTVCSACPSWDGIGPAGLPTTPSKVANCSASAAALVRSAAVSPPGRSYTTTAGRASGDWKDRWISSTLVDSALPGSHSAVSFSWAPVSFPASGPAIPTRTSQNTSTTNLVRRPVSRLAADLVMTPPAECDWA